MHSFPPLPCVPLPLYPLLSLNFPDNVVYLKSKDSFHAFRQRSLSSDMGQGEVGMMVLQEKAEELVRTCCRWRQH